MTYLRIGAAILTDTPATLSARYSIPAFTLPVDAPAFPPSHDYGTGPENPDTNAISFLGGGDYDQWLSALGLHDLFSNGFNGLTRNRAAVPARLLPWHAARLAQAYADYVAAYPLAVPGYGVGESSVLARLETLQWWVDYFIDLSPTSAAITYEP